MSNFRAYFNRSGLLAIGLIAFSFSSPLSAESPPIDVVFDLDGVLVEPATSSSTNVIEVTGVSYRVAHGAPELLEWLRQQPEVRISIFSAGTAPRNESLVDSFKLHSGKPLRSAIYHLITGDRDEISRKGKDLRKIPNLDLARAVLVDDQLNNAFEGKDLIQGPEYSFGQAANFLYTTMEQLLLSQYVMPGRPPNIEESLELILGYVESEDFSVDADSQEVRNLLNETFMNRNHTAAVAAVLDQIIRDARAGRDFAEALKPFSIFDKRHQEELEWRKDISFYRKGQKILSAINPGFRLLPLIPRETRTNKCSLALSALRPIKALSKK